MITPVHTGVAVVWLLLVVAGLAGGGAGPALIMPALPVLLVGVAALVAGRARWAFLRDRRAGGLAAAVAIVLLAIGTALAPPPPQPVAAPLTGPATTTTTDPPTTPVTTTRATTTQVTTTPALTTTAVPATTARQPVVTTTAPPPRPRTSTAPPATRRTTAAPPRTTTAKPKASCDPSYPTICVPLGGPDLDRGDIPHRRFPVLPPDRHGFDGGKKNGIGCESG